MPKHKLLGCEFINAEELQVREFLIPQIPQMMRLYLCNPRKPDLHQPGSCSACCICRLSVPHQTKLYSAPPGNLSQRNTLFAASGLLDHQAAHCHAPNQTSCSPEWKALSHGAAGGADPPPVPFPGTWAEEQGSHCSRTATDPLGTKNLPKGEAWGFFLLLRTYFSFKKSFPAEGGSSTEPKLKNWVLV